MGKPRSDFRVASVALMMANKFVDKCVLLLHCLFVHSCPTSLLFYCYYFATHTDTYTNTTSSEISGTPPPSELNKLEHKFLLSVDFWTTITPECDRSSSLLLAPERNRDHAARVYAGYANRFRYARLSCSDSSSYVYTSQQPQHAGSSSPQLSSSCFLSVMEGLSMQWEQICMFVSPFLFILEYCTVIYE